jgi:hypothetical protein
MKIAFLAAGNIGIEIFQFVDPPYTGPGAPTRFGRQHWEKGGCFHIAFTHPNPEELCAQLVKAGGQQIGETVYTAKGLTALYVQDPWGTVLEFCSRNFEAFLLSDYVPE